MHEIIRVGDLTVTLLKAGAETQGRLFLCEIIIPPGGTALIPHLHQDCEELVLGVAGITVWKVAGTLIHLRPGNRLSIPRGTLHVCTNPGLESARIACMYSPASVTADFFRELGLAAALSQPGQLDRITGVMARAGMLPTGLDEAPPSLPS